MFSFSRSSPDASRRPRRAAAARDQSGSTLLEVLVAIALVSIAIIGVFSGFSTTLKVSTDNSQRVALDETLAGVTDSLQRLPYTRCPTAAQVTQAYANFAGGYRPNGYSIVVTAVDFASSGQTQFQSVCPPGNAPQRLAVTISRVSDASISVSGQVVVTDPAARPAP